MPAIRIASASDRPVRREGSFVLYWMIGARRVRSNFALERAIAWCRELDRPLLVLEPLRCDHPYASERFHRFVLQGMRDHARALARAPVTYAPLALRAAGEGRHLLESLARDACVIVTDLSGVPFVRGMVRAASERVPIRLEAIDGLGLLPMRAAPRTFTTARSFRIFLQKTLPAHLEHAPQLDPLARLELPRLAAIPRALAELGPLSPGELDDPSALLASLPIDHAIGAIPDEGGGAAARARLRAFLREGLPRYAERSHPDADAASRLSSWLHWGHVSAHEVFHELARHTGWSIESLAAEPTGTKDGWWNASPEADAFLDELVTWRELGHVRAIHDPEGALSYEGIPAWARKTLAAHEGDPRPAIYDRDRLARAETDDPIWNAAQRQLLGEGRIQNYLRMLWGKKVLAWTRTPREAFEVLVELNDRYAIDGRDPNGWANIGWIFGSYDRPWGPERPIYGNVRYMTSDAARKKLRMKAWLARWSPRDEDGEAPSLFDQRDLR